MHGLETIKRMNSEVGRDALASKQEIEEVVQLKTERSELEGQLGILRSRIYDVGTRLLEITGSSNG